MGEIKKMLTKLDKPEAKRPLGSLGDISLDELILQQVVKK
jgi:hypothetical protein